MGPRSPGTSAAPARIANVPPSRVSIDRRCGGEHPGTWPPIGSGYRRVRSGCSARRNVTLVRPGPIGGWFRAARPAGTSHSFGPCGSMGSFRLLSLAGTSHSFAPGRSVGGLGCSARRNVTLDRVGPIGGWFQAARPAGTSLSIGPGDRRVRFGCSARRNAPPDSPVPTRRSPTRRSADVHGPARAVGSRRVPRSALRTGTARRAGRAGRRLRRRAARDRAGRGVSVLGR